MSDREIEFAVRLPEGFEPSKYDVDLIRQEVERAARAAWNSTIACLGETLLWGEPKRPLLPEGVSLRPGDKYGYRLIDAGARAVVRHVEVVSNG